MPALVNISVGSSLITIGAEGTMACCFDSKNFLNESRISLAVIISIYNLTIYYLTIYCFDYLLCYNFGCKITKNISITHYQ